MVRAWTARWRGWRLGVLPVAAPDLYRDIAEADAPIHRIAHFAGEKHSITIALRPGVEQRLERDRRAEAFALRFGDRADGRTVRRRRRR